jgi:hypothetical protein
MKRVGGMQENPVLFEELGHAFGIQPRMPRQVKLRREKSKGEAANSPSPLCCLSFESVSFMN